MFSGGGGGGEVIEPELPTYSRTKQTCGRLCMDLELDTHYTPCMQTKRLYTAWEQVREEISIGCTLSGHLSGHL